MPQKILGLDISSDSVAAVQVRGGARGYHVTACAHVMIEEAGGLGEALKALLEQLSPEADTCISSIPGEHVSYRNLRMPFRDKKKIRQTFVFELETMVPFPVEDVLADSIIVERSDQSEILAASVKQAYISEYLTQLQTFAVDPEVLDIRGVPTVAYLLSQEGIPDEGLFLDIGLKRSTMILHLNRRIALVRTFPFNGSAIVRHSGAQAAEQIEFCLKSFCTEVQNTIHAFGCQAAKPVRPERIFVTGSGSLYPDTDNLLNRFLELPVERVDLARHPGIHMDENIARGWNPALMDNALALAVREARQGLGFNFRKDRFEVTKQYSVYKKEIRKAAAFLIVVLCLLAFNLGVDYHFLDKRYTSLDQQITEVFKQTLPDVKRIVDPVHQLQAKLNEIKKSALSLPGLSTNRNVLDLLRDISLRVPESADVHMTRIVVDPNAVLIKGETDTFNTVDSIKKGLEPSDHFRAVTISSANLDRSGDRVQFEIKLDRAI